MSTTTRYHQPAGPAFFDLKSAKQPVDLHLHGNGGIDTALLHDKLKSFFIQMSEEKPGLLKKLFSFKSP